MNVFRYHSNTGNFIVFVVSKGPRWIRYVSLERYPVAIRRVPRKEEKYFKPIILTPKHVINTMLDVGKMYGITKAAKTALDKALNNDTPIKSQA